MFTFCLVLLSERSHQHQIISALEMQCFLTANQNVTT